MSTPMSALKRIASEARNLTRDPPEPNSFTLGPADPEDLYHWAGTVTGSQDTPYAGGIFTVAIEFDDTYPRKPFQLTMTTPVFHPNVSGEGEVQLAELQQDQWSPVMTARMVMLGLQAMLSGPNPLEECIVNVEAAVMFAEDKEAFERTAREWVDACARPTEGEGG